MAYIHHILASCRIGHKTFGGTFHLGIKIKKDMFFPERFTTVRFALTVQILFLAELFSAEQMQIHMLFIGCGFQIGGVRYNNAKVLITVPMVVNSNVVQLAGIEILMLYIHVKALHLIAENALRYLQFGVLGVNCIKNGIKPLGSMRNRNVLEIKRYTRQKD